MKRIYILGTRPSVPLSLGERAGVRAKVQSMKRNLVNVRLLSVVLALFILPPSSFILGDEVATPPTAVDPGIEITLFAEHPDVVTPTGIEVDARGRVFVLENNTHHRQEQYQGYPTDRIFIFEDTDGDGTSDNRAVFHEGHTLGTDLVFGPDGDLYASTRWDIYHLPDTDGDDRADKVTRIIHTDTVGDYPHNGVSGICFDRDGILHFGLGENLGEPYTLIGTDGTRLSGGGEGGSMYRCHADGSKLERIATGVWNPFGMGFDTGGNLFATDNDPGSSPPCRLLHVVDGADYGYEFRYGRTGLHPLVTWTGEFPGTVGMVSGTGEAPCGVIAYGPGKLLVASWADHRIDLYKLIPQGASFAAVREPFIQGGNEFRPVDIARGPDGAFYFTDWVSSSYPVHGQGRVWRFKPAQPPSIAATEPHADILRAARIRARHGADDPHSLLETLAEDDPFIRSAAIDALRKSGPALLQIDWQSLPLPGTRAGILVALKKSGLEAARTQIPAFLEDDALEVRFAAVKWIADDQLTEYRALVESELRRPGLNSRMFLAAMAALDRLDGKKPKDAPAPENLYEFLVDESASPALRAVALRLMPPHYKKLSLETLAAHANHADPALRLEAIRTLGQHPDEGRGDILADIAKDSARPATQRAEAVVGLALLAEKYAAALGALADDENPEVRSEAGRALIGVSSAELQRVPSGSQGLSPADLPAWDKYLRGAAGNAEAGRRLFFHPKVGTCYRCHRMEGRGVRVGPDLTTIWKRADREWLLESILQPNAMIAPQFLTWQINLKDGSTLMGLPLRKGGTRETYLGLDGKEFSVTKPDILGHQELQASLMPPGLLEQMTRGEISDLLAYLLAEK